MQEEKQFFDRRKKKIIVWFAVFLAFMWICTLVSKSIYVSRLPMISTVSPEQKYVEHRVEAEGIVTEGGKQAVTSLDGLRVEEIMVHVGDRIEEGDALFAVDLEDLKEIMKEKQNSAAKLQYQIDALMQNEELAKQRKALQEERAREDYDDAAKKKDTDVGRAAEEYVQADEDLEEHENNPVFVTSDRDREKAWEKYEAWVKKENELLKKIAEQEKIVTNLESTSASQGDNDAEGSDASSQVQTEEEKKELEAAKAELQALREALASHEKNQVEKPDFSGEDSALKAWQQQEEALKDALQNAAYAEADAKWDRDSTMKEAGRTVEDSLLPDTVDATLAVCQLDLSTLKEQIARYQQIIDDKGYITAEKSGMVTDIYVSVGGRVPDTAAMLLTDDEMPCQLKVVLTAEQKKYVGLNDKVSLKLSGSSKGMDASIDYLSESVSMPGCFETYINLPKETGVPGLSGTLTCVEAGEKYRTCISPLAIHEENKRYFVYVVKEREGILGMEYYVEEVNVKILDQNDDWAAIEGALDDESQIIVSSTKDVSRGDIVRWAEY